MKDFLFVNLFLNPPGGGEGVANWMIQVLCQRGSLSILVWDPPDLAQIDRYYGTNLANQNIEVITVAPSLRQALRFFKIPHRLLGLVLLQRKANRIASNYRRCFSAFNRLDLGSQPAVQYCHNPEGKAPRRNPWPNSLWTRAMWPIYETLLALIFKPNRINIEHNITLANSHWTARALLAEDMQPVHRVIYPPPLGEPGLKPSESRKYGFVSLGRLDPTKNWEGIIETIERVRTKGFNVCLTLLCSQYDAKTLEKISALAKARSSWIRLQIDQDRKIVDNELSEHEFALHAMKDEHYGMAVAEMVLSGCLTFVHDSGGQVEIVTTPETRYSSSEEAAKKIVAILADPKLKDKLKREQSAQAEKLTRQRFCREFKQLVDDLERGQI